LLNQSLYTVSQKKQDTTRVDKFANDHFVANFVLSLAVKEF